MIWGRKGGLYDLLRRFTQTYRSKSMGDARQGKGSWGEFFGFVKSVGFYPSTTVDVGVAEGTDKLYSMFPRSKVILVEPIEEFKPELEEIAHKYNGKYIIAAAGPEEGSIPIRVYTKNLGLQSCLQRASQNLKTSGTGSFR